MAYAAAVYLLQILEQLQQSDQFSGARYPKSQIHHLQEKICSLKDFLEKNSSLEDSRESTNHLESQIRDAIYEAEDFIESHISTLFLSPESASSVEENHLSIFSEDLKRVIQDFDSIAEKTKKFTVQVGHDLIHSSLPANRVSSRPALHPEDIIVGRHDDREQLLYRLTVSTLVFDVVPIVGISGIGKTILAKAVYNDPLVESVFEIRAWIKVSHEYHKRDILLGLLRSMVALGGGQRQETDDQLAKCLYDSLKSKRYLVVLDDVCDIEAWNYLKELFPEDYKYKSRVIVTTRSVDVARVGNKKGPLHQVLELAEEDTWDLLRRIVFVDELWPPELEQTAKSIARDCRGLPLAIVIIGRVLAKASITGWHTAASSISACENCDELIEVVLSLTYRSLPQYFKACLLYMGIFPRKYEIPVSKLINLWIAEGFLEVNGSQTLEEMAEELLLQLVERSLVSGCEQSSRGKIKTCMIDDVFMDFVKRKAEKEKFFHVINKHTDVDGFMEDARAQRRLCILKNIRFGRKDVANYNSKAWVSTARSLLYSGPIHQHPLRVWLDFKLLRLLDALNIRFYSFPLEILKLVQLRYLGLTYNWELPASVCKLRNLQFLIVLRNRSTKCSGDLLHLPMEIWRMKELRHLQFMGRDLPDPSTAAGEILEDLLTLSDVGSHSCTPGVLQRIPNLKKLGIQTSAFSVILNH